MRKMSKFWLFLTALSPALLIANVRLLNYWNTAAWIGIAVSVLLFGSTFIIFRMRKNVSPTKLIVRSVSDDSGQVPTYLITFIFPFLFVSDSPDLPTIGAYSLFLLLMLLLLYRTDLSLVNPALLILGFHVYSVDEGHAGKVIVLSRELPVPGEIYKSRIIFNNLFLLDEDSHKELNSTHV